MIVLTRDDGEECLVNPDHIAEVYASKGGSIVYFDTVVEGTQVSISIKETLNEVKGRLGV